MAVLKLSQISAASSAPALTDQAVAVRGGNTDLLYTFTQVGTTLAGGTSLQLQYNTGTGFGGMAGTSWDNTNRSLTMTGTTITANAPILSLSQTWNNSGVTFQGVLLNITNTAAGNNSNSLEIQDSGTTRFAWRVTGSGVIYQQFGPSGQQPRLQVAIDGDSFARINFGMNSGDTPSFGLGPGGGSPRSSFLGYQSPGVIFVANQDDGLIGGTFRYRVSAPNTLASGSTNDYDPVANSGSVSYFQTWTANAANSTVTGFNPNAGAAVGGQVHLIINIGSGTLTIANQNAGSTAGFRFLNSTGADIVLSTNQAVEVVYDSTVARWRAFKLN